MRITMGSARSTVTPVKEEGQRFAPTYVPSGVFTNGQCETGYLLSDPTDVCGYPVTAHKLHMSRCG
jgi:hypothetical protein